MSVQRIEVRVSEKGFALVFEWDEDAGWLALGIGDEQGDLSGAWSMVTELSNALLKLGLGWTTEELRERRGTGGVCGIEGAVLVWRMTATSVDTRLIAETVVRGLGV